MQEKPAISVDCRFYLYGGAEGNRTPILYLILQVFSMLFTCH
nr:MAG TPA: hypothetical protein [Caudoviricetes sp.]